MKTYSTDFKEKVINSVLNDGMPIKEASRFYHLDRNTVRMWIRKKQGLISEVLATSSTEEEKTSSIKRILAGESINKVAHSISRNPSTVYRWMKDYELSSLKKELEKLKNQSV